MIYSSVKSIKPNKEDGLFLTSEFISTTIKFILKELFEIQTKHTEKFGDMVICLDNYADGYWRRDYYAGYKMNRKSGRDKSEVNFDEVFSEINKLTEQILLNLPWKVVDVSRCEADDIILVLSREYNKFEKILIHSPDKDFIQAQRDTNNVFQYSALTKQWLVAEAKADDMNDWIQAHVCLGDESDGVPRVNDRTVFSENFILYLKNAGHNIETVVEFKESSLSTKTKRSLLSDYDVWLLNKKLENTGIKDVYFKPRFGPTTLKKEIAKLGSLDAWLDSHPLYRENYKRNFILVMEEGIPSNYWTECIIAYKKAEKDYNINQFEEYLKNNNLNSVILELSSVFKLDRGLTADDFGW
jgi:5'-3' exonuclease